MLAVYIFLECSGRSDQSSHKPASWHGLCKVARMNCAYKSGLVQAGVLFSCLWELSDTSACISGRPMNCSNDVSVPAKDRNLPNSALLLHVEQVNILTAANLAATQPTNAAGRCRSRALTESVLSCVSFLCLCLTLHSLRFAALH